MGVVHDPEKHGQQIDEWMRNVADLVKVWLTVYIGGVDHILYIPQCTTFREHFSSCIFIHMLSHVLSLSQILSHSVLSSTSIHQTKPHPPNTRTHPTPAPTQHPHQPTTPPQSKAPSEVRPRSTVLPPLSALVEPWPPELEHVFANAALPDATPV